VPVPAVVYSLSLHDALPICMFEHVGVRNYAEYMRVVRGLLKPDGLFLLHTIGRNESARHTNPWIAKYIFPNSMLPSIRQIGEARSEEHTSELQSRENLVCRL